MRSRALERRIQRLIISLRKANMRSEAIQVKLDAAYKRYVAQNG